MLSVLLAAAMLYYFPNRESDSVKQFVIAMIAPESGGVTEIHIMTNHILA